MMCRMKGTTRLILIVTLSGLALTMSGCSGLSRSKALEEVQTFPLQTGPAALLVKIGRVSSRCFIDPTRGEYVFLSKIGLLRVSSVGKSAWDVGLTDLGKKASRGDPYAHELRMGVTTGKLTCRTQPKKTFT
jgi:hypothetical protein